MSLISRSGDIPTIHKGVVSCIFNISISVACSVPVRRLELMILMVYRTALFWDITQRRVEIPYRGAANNGNSLPGRTV